MQTITKPAIFPVTVVTSGTPVQARIPTGPTDLYPVQRLQIFADPGNTGTVSFCMKDQNGVFTKAPFQSPAFITLEVPDPAAMDMSSIWIDGATNSNKAYIIAFQSRK